MRASWTLGAMIAIGIGVGAALADSLGAAGYAGGIAAAVLAFHGSGLGQRPCAAGE